MDKNKMIKQLNVALMEMDMAFDALAMAGMIDEAAALGRVINQTTQKVDEMQTELGLSAMLQKAFGPLNA